MPNHDLELSTPESFPVFPYDPPYSIQLELMKHLYASLESRKVAVLESPTGTGKTLSLLCGSLTWLKDDQERSKKGRLAAMEESLRGDSNEPAWVLKQALEAQKREMEDLERALGDRLERARKKEEALRRKENGRVRKRAKLSHTTPVNDNNDIQYLPDDESGGDNDYSHLSKDVQEMLRKYEVRNAPQVDALEENEPTCTKIFYASRTHTQLSQTISELQKTTLGPTTRAVPLGSRKNMCINDELRSKAGDLDEACRELMSGKSGHRCPYMPAPGEESRLLEFRDHILATPRDIEDTVELGKDLNTCPYYGSRKAIPQAEACKEYACYVLTYIFPQLVILPYNLLLQKNSREALGIDLKDHIVIVDEAH
ncbi:ATP-dependent DNA helicase chl1, partial [Tulasnella sp. 403]